jgi:hypothetical protein
MVEFLYIGDYDATPRQSDAAGLVESPELVQGSPNNVLLLVSGGDDVVLSYVRVSAIADYYDIKGLEKLSHLKIQSSSSERWSI